MAHQKINILLIPEDAEEIKHYRLPKTLVFCIIPFLMIFTVVLTWLLWDYKIIKHQVLQISHVEREIEANKWQFFRLSRQIIQTTWELRDLNKSVPKAVSDHIPAPVRNTVNRGSIEAHDLREMIPLMHRVLAQLDDATAVILPGGMNGKTLNNKKGPIKKEADYTNFAFRERKGGGIKKKIEAIANEIGLDPNLAVCMAKIESGYNPGLVSPKGAIGVFQVMPNTALHHFGINRDELFDPETNILVGLTWMKLLLKKFGNDLNLSLAAYNAGASRVIRAGHRIPPIKETRTYVKKIRTAMKNHVTYFSGTP